MTAKRRLNLEGRAGLNEPTQDRSLETARRIIVTTRELMRRKPFEQITMPEIAAESGVSIGSIYARFPGKEKLLLALVDVFFRTEFDEAVDEVVNPRQGDDLESFLARYFSSVVEAFRTHRDLLRPLTLHARASSDAELSRYLRDVNGAIHERLRTAILAHRSEITHPEPATAIDLALLWAGAALREKFIYAEPVSALGGVDDETYVSELVTSINAYLTLEGGSRR